MEDKKENKEGKESRRNPFLRFLLGALKFIFWTLLIVIIVLAVILILAVIAAFLFYNFFTIKTAVFCVGAFERLPIQCASNSECADSVLNYVQQQGSSEQTKGENINEGMNLIRGFLKGIFSDAVQCNAGYCEVKKVRGIEEIFNSDKPIECTADEQKREIKITPKMIFPFSSIKAMASEFFSTGKIAMPSF